MSTPNAAMEDIMLDALDPANTVVDANNNVLKQGTSDREVVLVNVHQISTFKARLKAASATEAVPA